MQSPSETVDTTNVEREEACPTSNAAREDTGWTRMATETVFGVGLGVRAAGPGGSRTQGCRGATQAEQPLRVTTLNPSVLVWLLRVGQKRILMKMVTMGP